ncbi:hypothetical protein BHE74_00009492 [Ensete ventricosum]|nr:hypothetical protein BHE74_00009492 [Ensete ventricosum]RZR95323.1 hypothetical protein BHM03_00024159 [Ensete ventricosum]
MRELEIWRVEMRDRYKFRNFCCNASKRCCFSVSFRFPSISGLLGSTEVSEVLHLALCNSLCHGFDISARVQIYRTPCFDYAGIEHYQ